MEPDKIADSLRQHREAVVAELGKRNHFANYLLIRKKFSDCDIDEDFKSKFCRFYILNGPAGLNATQKEKFFELLGSGENNLSLILKALREVPGHRGAHSLFLSFGTKLLHTLDNSLPIYDKNIATVLALTSQQQTGAVEDKANNRVKIYEELKSNFLVLFAREDVMDYLKDMRKELLIEYQTVSDAKLLDSILWALYSVKNK